MHSGHPRHLGRRAATGSHRGPYQASAGSTLSPDPSTHAEQFEQPLQVHTA